MNEEDSERARAAIFEAIDTQLAEGEPPETAETLDRLMNEGHDRDEAYRLIGSVLADEVFRIMKHEREYDAERYIRLLKKLPQMPWDE